jgi:plexin A
VFQGTTFTSYGDYRHDVPAISSRNLHDLTFAEYSFSKQSLLRIDVKFRDRFLVNYVYGFNTTQYIFFMIVQKKSHLPGIYLTFIILPRALFLTPDFGL